MDIKDVKGDIIYSTSVNGGSKRKYTLMGEDYMTLVFSVNSPITFHLGDYVEDSRFGLFELVSLYNPIYNTATGAYDYELRLDAYYWKWKNKVFKFTPEVGGQEASWNLTATLDVHMGIFLRNLAALGYTYKGEAFEFSIAPTVEKSAKLVSYDNTNMIDALSAMAETWDCEWWVTDKTINFGRCEYGTPVDFEIGDNVVEMTSSESKSTYATRIYAFGSTRNIPSNYRPVDESIVVNGVVQKRLMLPEGTPYIDAYPDMSTEEAVEQVVVFDDIYPRTDGHISKVITYTDTVNNEDGTQTTETFYQFTDTGITFSKDYILEGEELHIIFQSGSLNGMDFGVTFNPMGDPEKNEDGSWNPKAQLWGIVANEDYGRKLPDDVLKPKEGDTYILYGWDSSKIADLGLVSAAEQELKDKAEEYVAKSRIDPNTYSCTMMSDYMYGLDEGGNQNPDYAKHFDVGDKVNLVNSAFFESGNRQSRIIGYECNLDKPYDSPVYTVGETASYSRIGELEEQIENITLKGQTYTGGGGSGIYVIGTNDTTSPTNRNVYSALRVLQSFLSKTTNDRTPFKLEVGDKLTAEKGLQIGESFVPGIVTGSGGFFDKFANGEVESLIIRRFLEVPELRFNRVKIELGDKWNAPGAGIFESVEPDKDSEGNPLMTGTGYLKLEEGEYGAIAVGDICMGIFHSENPSDNASSDSDDSRGNFMFAGFYTCYFTITEITGSDNKQFRYQLRPVSDRWKLTFHPSAAMHFVSYGSFTDESRQTSQYTTRTYTRMLWKQNTWEISSANIAMQYGDLSNMSIHGLDMVGYSMYLNSVYFTGRIKEVKPDGTPIYRANDRGAWVSGTKYDFYDRVSHNGSIWLCVNEDGTNSEPAKGNPDWLLQVEKGDPGESAVFADLTNQMDNVTLTNDGKVYQDTSISTVAWMSYGSKKMTLTGITCTLPANVTETHDVSTGEITFSVKQGVALDGRNPIPVALTATYNGKAYTGQLTFTLAGVKGGADAVLYRLVPSVSAVIKDANGNLNVTSVSCTRLKSSVSGGTAETGTGELKYSLDGGAEVSIGNNAGVPVSSFQKNIKFIFYVDGTVVDVETIPLVVDGKDGQSVSSLGRWHTGLIVPKLGIVTMGGSTFCAKKETTNPPLWTTTTSDGRRITQTQDGGRTYGYILSGESNTEEYDLLVQSGKDGSDGTDYERVFIHTTKESRPSTPATSQTDDYIPSGWHDDPIGVSESLPFEWISEREKRNGIWSNFSTPALWAKYGFDGIDGAEGVAGTSIVWKGDFSSAPSSPQNGWAYKNTTDKKSYVYQDGQWYQMTIDGIDGKNGKDGLSIVWKGDLQSPPSNPQINWAYRDTNNGRVYIWNGTAWSLMVVDGSDGADGAAGSNGLSVFITYNDSTSQPSVPTGNGTTGGWHTNATSGAIWMSQKVASSASDGTWGTPIKIKGDKGDSITAMGRWYTGLIVPKQGVVTMGGSSYIAKKETTNPPLWTVTTSSGQRIKQTQDGGKTYGYILSGEMNSAEYDLLASKGEDGKPGADGKPGVDGKPGADGKQGIQGCIIRHSEWSKFSVQYRNDESLTSGTRYLDVALVKDSQSPTGWEAYKCKNTHTSSESNAPGTSGGSSYWEVFSMTASYIFTSLIIAKDASIDFFQGNQLLIKNSANKPVLGMTGGDHEGYITDVRLWIDEENGMYPDRAKFRVYKSGRVVATDVDLTGTINATSGTFKNVSSPNGAFKIKENGDVELVGKISTSLNGTRIELDPSSNSIKMYNQDNNEVGNISFITESIGGVTNYYPRLMLRRYSGSKEVGRLDMSGTSVNGYSTVGTDALSFTLGPIGLVFSVNGQVTNSYPNK